MNTDENEVKNQESMYGRKICFRISNDDYKKFEELFMQSGINSRGKFIKKCIFGNANSKKKSEEKMKKQWKEVEQLLQRIKTETLLNDNYKV